MLGLQFRNAHLALRKKSPDYNRKEALRIKLTKYSWVGGYGNPCSLPHVRSSCLLTGASISNKYMYFKSKLHPRSKTLAATYLNRTYNLQLLSISKNLLRSESAEVLRKQDLGLRESVYMLEEAKSLRIASDICCTTFETLRKGCQSSAVTNMHAWSLSEGEVDVVRVGLCCNGLSWRCGK